MHSFEDLLFELKLKVARYLTRKSREIKTLRRLAICSESWARAAWPILWEEAVHRYLTSGEAPSWANHNEVLRYGRNHIRKITLYRLLRCPGPNKFMQLIETNRWFVRELKVELIPRDPSLPYPSLTLEPLALTGFVNLRRLEFELCYLNQLSDIFRHFPQVEEFRSSSLFLDNLDDLLADGVCSYGQDDQERPACQLKSFKCGRMDIQNWPISSSYLIDTRNDPAAASSVFEAVRRISYGFQAKPLVTLREASFGDNFWSCWRAYESIPTYLFYALTFSKPLLSLTCLSVVNLYQDEVQLVVTNAPNLVRLELCYSIMDSAVNSVEAAVQTVLVNLRHLKYHLLSKDPGSSAPNLNPRSLAVLPSGAAPGGLLRPTFACQGLKLFKAPSYEFESSDILLSFAHLSELETLVVNYKHIEPGSLRSVLGSNDSSPGVPFKAFPRLESFRMGRVSQRKYDIPEQECEELAALLALFPALRRCTIYTAFDSTAKMLPKHFRKVKFNIRAF
ncbi:hypothetical protein EV182_001217 [Spiromyces aspiralis]|uniref:Uncharacterized protein n=1 Tax=Spiromyces aspiralis TaxID=68401 RepID=A0ACC1HTF4_9FUNG|nr:hypothetical protein EV182_001217 [Spiromyces aspiralis]